MLKTNVWITKIIKKFIKLLKKLRYYLRIWEPP